jgi:polygalacturonase
MIEITGQNFSPPVTIDLRDATVMGVRITDSSGIIFRGGTIEAPEGLTGDTPGSHAIRLKRFRDIVLDDVTVTNAKHGMVAGDGLGLTVRNSRFTGMRSDGIDSAGNSNVLIENNRFTGSTPKHKIGIRGEPGFIDGDHADAVQIWASKATRAAHDIVVRNNFIEGDTQGITTFGDTGDGYQRIVVENNHVKVQFPAAIAVMHCTDCRVRYNVISAYPGARFPINVRTDESSGLFCDNKMLDRPDHRVAAKCPKDAGAGAKNTAQN